MESSFGNKLRQLHIERNETLEVLASGLGGSVVYISDVERGRRGPLNHKKIEQVALILNTPATELQNCADKDNNRVELRLDRGQIFLNTALAIARNWETMTEENAIQIMKILNTDCAKE